MYRVCTIIFDSIYIVENNNQLDDVSEVQFDFSADIRPS